MRDGYLEFFERFNISDDDFLDFVRSSIILIPEGKAKIEWEELKRKINQKDELVYVRSYARNGSGNHLYKNFYKSTFLCDIKIDINNNTNPTKLLENLTGESKKGKSVSLRNFQVSHIFGNTKNPYSFCAPWNVTFIPKIIDPFTGHESKGELTDKVTHLCKELMWEKYEDLILDYNELMLELNPKINYFIENDDYEKFDKKHQRFHESIRSEFSTIKRDKK